MHCKWPYLTLNIILISHWLDVKKKICKEYVSDSECRCLFNTNGMALQRALWLSRSLTWLCIQCGKKRNLCLFQWGAILPSLRSAVTVTLPRVIVTLALSRFRHCFGNSENFDLWNLWLISLHLDKDTSSLSVALTLFIHLGWGLNLCTLCV